MSKRRKRSVSLVLGSGGARGAAHIGVIRWLAENNYDIRSVSGCSIGALIGGVYAADKLDEFEDWLCAITEREMFRLMDLSWQISGLVKGDRIIDTLKDLVGDRLIEELPIRYTAVAASLDGEKEVWLQDGPLFDAIRASISLPLLLTPTRRDGKTLIDGGVLNPVPIAPTFGDGTDLCIAVNLGGAADGHCNTDKSADDDSDHNRTGLRAKIDAFIDKLGINNGSKGDSSKDWGPFEIANQAFDAMQATISRQKLAVYPPDELIEIPRNACGTMDFQHAAKMIKLGYEQAETVMAGKRH
ncbi:patatin-like phospholipase family protein [Woeseia oceani]|uniref:Serine protease n=1 Tax=Woeseia oceani TaxID=1548547 RepID=A0A193LIQ5_9GAMM|nr:patatin-like phospholipase family protein [Woeseia oceani]ANO52405.1 serine protease [Woeseia oceani]